MMDRQQAVAEALTDLSDALDRLGKVAGNTFDMITEDTARGRMEPREAAAFLASFYAMIYELRQRLQLTEAAVDSKAARWMSRAGFKATQTAPPMFMSEGVRVKLNMTGGKQTWDRRGCFRAVVNKITAPFQGDVVNTETGEQLDIFQFANTIMEWIEKVAPTGNLRTTPLKALEIKPDSYREIEGGRLHCTVMGTVKETE